MNAMAATITDLLMAQSLHLVALFAVVSVLALAFRRGSAHLRYLLWSIILVKCLIPPWLTLPMAVLPGPVDALPGTEAGSPATEPPPQVVGQDLPAVLSTETAAGLDLSVGTAQMSEPPAWGRVSDTRQVVLWIWAAGLLVFLWATSVRAWCFARRLRRFRRAIPGRLAHEIHGLAQAFRPGMTVRAYQLEGLGQPFVWGMLRGAIYLPARFAATGTAGRRRSVLQHELAHAVRLDPLVNGIQILAQALYWFHPLVWAANRRIRAEREKCCDEMVVAQFRTPPQEYGRAIVDALTQDYESPMAVPSLAVAGPVKNIEDRIKTLMKPGQQFYRRPGVAVWCVVLLVAAILTPATIALMPRTGDAAAYRAVFSNGLTVELVGLRQHPGEGAGWWRPDGTPWAATIQTRDPSAYTSTDPAYALVFRQTGTGTFVVDSVRGCRVKSRLEVSSPESLSVYRVHIPSRYRQTDVTLATPTGAWHPVHVSQSVTGSTSATVHGKTIILAAVVPAAEGALVSCSDTWGYNEATRIVAVDTEGRTHTGTTLTDTGVQGVRQRTLRYEHLAAAEMAALRFEACAYEVRTLKHIRLAAKTDAAAETQTPPSVQDPRSGLGDRPVRQGSGEGR